MIGWGKSPCLHGNISVNLHSDSTVFENLEVFYGAFSRYAVRILKS